jgi:hypothetical protein
MAVRRKHLIIFVLLLACASLLTFIVSGHSDSASQARPGSGISSDSVALADGVRRGPTGSTTGATASRAPGSAAPGTSISTDPVVIESGSTPRSPAPPPLAAPSLSIAPPSIPNSGPSPSGSTTAPGQPSTPVRTATSASSSTALFQEHAVNAATPAKFLFLPVNAAMQATTTNCATTGAACAGVVSGTTSTCTYPAFSASMTNVIAVGYSMWMYGPNLCRYAMGVVMSSRIG